MALADTFLWGRGAEQERALVRAVLLEGAWATWDAGLSPADDDALSAALSRLASACEDVGPEAVAAAVAGALAEAEPPAAEAPLFGGEAGEARAEQGWEAEGAGGRAAALLQKLSALFQEEDPGC